MLDTIKIGLLRLATRGKPHGYMRIIPKNEGETISSFFRIPLHVVFDQEGYNTYKECKNKENAEYKTWVHDVTINVPPNPDNCEHYPNAGYEWFLGNLRDLSMKNANFPSSLKGIIDKAIKEYSRAKKKEVTSEIMEDDYDPPPMTEAERIAAYHAITIYGILQRSRFDPGRPERKGEFRIRPFYRLKDDKTAKEMIEEITNLVSDYVWKNPKVSKYSETEGAGLKFKLTSLFLECIYKDQIRFMKAKLELDMQLRRKSQRLKKEQHQ